MYKCNKLPVNFSLDFSPATSPAIADVGLSLNGEWNGDSATGVDVCDGNAGRKNCLIRWKIEGFLDFSAFTLRSVLKCRIWVAEKTTIY